jgi:hypothetical protein
MEEMTFRLLLKAGYERPFTPYHPFTPESRLPMSDETKPNKQTPVTVVPTVPDTRPTRRSQGFLGELFSLAEEAKDLVSEVAVSTITSGRPPSSPIQEEPFDPALVHALRALLIDRGSEGIQASFHDHKSFRIVIGSGISMRVYDAPSVTSCILRACASEAVTFTGKGERESDSHY